MSQSWYVASGHDLFGWTNIFRLQPRGPSDHDIRHIFHHEAPEKLLLHPDQLEQEILQFRSDWLNQNVAPTTQSLLEYQHERICNISQYEKLFPRLFDATKPLEPDWFDATLWAAVRQGTPEALKSVLSEEFPGVYSLPFFSKAFCDVFLEEMLHFESSGLPWRRPNSMNRYGVVVDDIGMEQIMQKMMLEVVAPFAALLYPSQGGATLDHHHAFVVQYQQGQDVKLEMHTDDSEVTLNVCLGRDGFQGSGLTFCGQYVHQECVALRFQSLTRFCSTQQKGSCGFPQIQARIQALNWEGRTSLGSTATWSRYDNGRI